MGKEKGGFLSPKAIANRIKSKGLQKLKWYCQMCSKQCRDENGFKCHITSESHQRQLLLCADNPNKYVNDFSQEFRSEFIQLLKVRYNTRRVRANQVYQEYIAEKDHVHMNSTKWHTLTGFVHHLGKTGVVKVDDTEKGWFITYIDRDPEVLRRQEQKDRIMKDDQERERDFIQKQVELGMAEEKNVRECVATELQRKEEGEVVTFGLGSNGETSKKEPKLLSSAVHDIFKKDQSKRSASDDQGPLTKKSKTDKCWFTPGIVVRITSDRLMRGSIKLKKAVVETVDEKSQTADIKLLDSTKFLTVQMKDVETVVPPIGKKVKVVSGYYMGVSGTVEKLHMDSLTLDISSKGKMIKGLSFTSVSKLFHQ